VNTIAVVAQIWRNGMELGENGSIIPSWEGKGARADRSPTPEGKSEFEAMNVCQAF